MPIHVATITMKSRSPRRLAAFWCQFLGYEVTPHPTASVRLDDPNGSGPTLLVQPGPKPLSGGVIHVDLRPDDQEQALTEALRLGAKRVEIGQTGDESWVVLADPDGNPFCILQSQADLAERS